MALAEDAASVLEEFVQNAANLPAEIAHLLEEIQAKDRVVQDCRSDAASRDASIQKFLKLNGAGQANPKEEPYTKAILADYDKAQAFQEEKISLADRISLVLDRQIKRLDLKIRDLQNEGAIAIDPQLPSLLNNNNNSSTLNSRLPPLTTSISSTSTPLHPLSGNAGPSTTIANNPLSRLVQQPTRQPSPLTTTAPITVNSTLAAPSASRSSARSPSTDTSKRRRLNATHLSIPATSSSLRQSSLGPGTPKGSHPALPNSRSGSAGPRPSQSHTALKTASKSTARPPHQRISHLNPSQPKAGGGSSKKRSRPSKQRHQLAFSSKDGSTGGDGNESSFNSEPDADAMELDLDGEGLEEGDEGEGDDKKLYCTCQKISSGDMVACDNDDCPFEWFHWACVGVKEEPKGAWFCDLCRAKLGK